MLCKDTLPKPGNIYLFQVNNRNRRKSSDICSKLAIKILETHHWGRLVSSLLTLNYFTPFPSFPIIYFEQVNVSRVTLVSLSRVHEDVEIDNKCCVKICWDFLPKTSKNFQGILFYFTENSDYFKNENNSER